MNKKWTKVFESLANPDSDHKSQAIVRDIIDRLHLDWYEFVGRFVKFLYWKWNNDVDLITPETAEFAKVRMTASWVDEFLNCPGFAAELLRVGWLEYVPGSDLLVSSEQARINAMRSRDFCQARDAAIKTEKAAKVIEQIERQAKKPKATAVAAKPAQEPKPALTLAALRKQKAR